MNCLIVAATVFEITPFLEKLKANDGLSNNIAIDVAITGVGLTSATYSLSRQLNLKRPDIIIQAGIGGCFDQTKKLGSVFAIKGDAIADQGVVEKGKMQTLFDMGFVAKNKAPFSKGWLVNKNEVLKKVKLKKVNAVSVNEITSSKKKVLLYKEKFHPVVESMEGAALHYVCLMEKIPFIQIRSISNYVGERNKKNWKIQESINNLNNELIRLLELL